MVPKYAMKSGVSTPAALHHGAQAGADRFAFVRARDGLALVGAVHRLCRGEALTAEETTACLREVMEGRATPVQMATLLVAIRVRGATPQEVAGGVRALRALGYNPSVWHMNEGHAAFLTLERAREFVAGGDTFEQAMDANDASMT